jgi:hypothetical protein
MSFDVVGAEAPEVCALRSDLASGNRCLLRSFLWRGFLCSFAQDFLRFGVAAFGRCAEPFLGQFAPVGECFAGLVKRGQEELAIEVPALRSGLDHCFRLRLVFG